MKTIKMKLFAAGLAMAVAATPAFAATEAAAPAAAAPSSAAAAAPALAYGFVDLGHIMAATNVAKQANDELSAKKKEITAEFGKKGDALKAQIDSLMQQKSTMAQADFEKKMIDLQKKGQDLQRAFEDRKRGFDIVMSKTIKQIQDQAGDIVQQVAQEKGYAAVFTREAVFIGARNLDITDEVIDRMNKSGKKVSIDWSAATTAASAPAKSSKK